MNLFSVNEATIYYSMGAVANHPQIMSSKTLYDVFITNWTDIDHRETFYAAYLNRANRLICFQLIGKGGIAGTVADPKIIFQAALLCNACSIILMHNHPSGNLSPSDNDIQLTRKIKNAGAFLDMVVCDHLIFTSSSYYSFADEGIL